MTQEEKKAKKREYDITYRAANGARLKRQNAERYANDREKNRAIRRAYYAANRTARLAYQKIHGPLYWAAHKEARQEYQRVYKARNKERLQKRDAAYAAAHAEEKQKYGEDYYRKNKSQILKKAKPYLRKRYQTNPNFKLRVLLSCRIREALKGNVKSARTIALLGCSIEFLREHLEKQFAPGMTWENHSMRGWHVDHKKPCAKFDLTDPEQQKQCFHYTNLQPLWAKDNLQKSDAYGS